MTDQVLEEESMDPVLSNLQRYSNDKEWCEWRLRNKQLKALDCPRCGHHEMDCSIVIGVSATTKCPKCGYKQK